MDFQLVDCTTLKREVAEGVDLMVVRELTAGQSYLIEFILKKLLFKSIYGYGWNFYGSYVTFCLQTQVSILESLGVLL